MAYIFGIIVLLLLFVVLHFFTEISAKQKSITVGILALLIAGAYGYNYMSEQERLHVEHVILEFKQHKTLKCDGIDVNSTLFSYSSVTLVNKWRISG